VNSVYATILFVPYNETGLWIPLHMPTLGFRGLGEKEALTVEFAVLTATLDSRAFLAQGPSLFLA
jgi:hypothetical protein